MKDDRPPAPDLEERLRAALRAEAARMPVSPNAWANVRSRLANRVATPEPRHFLRRFRRSHPGGPRAARPRETLRDTRPPAGPSQDASAPGWRSRLPRPVVVGAAVLASAAATTAVLLLPQLTNPSQVAGPASTASPEPLTDSGTQPSPRPTSRVTPTSEPAGPTTLASVTAGTDLRLVLDATHHTAGDTTVWLRLLHFDGGSWRPVDEARVGDVTPVPAANLPKVCELTVATTSAGNGSADGSDGPAVRVRLAADTSTPCSRPYDFDLRGDRLVAR